MDLSGRTTGSAASSNPGAFLQNSSMRSNQQPPLRYQTGSSTFVQPFQASPTTSEQQRIFQRKMQEMQLMQLRQNHMQQQMQQQVSPRSSQLQQSMQNPEQHRWNPQISPGLHISPSPLATPNFARPLMASPSSSNNVGFGSIGSIKSVVSHQISEKNNVKGPKYPPAPPLTSTSLATASSTARTNLNGGNTHSTFESDSKTNLAQNTPTKKHPVNAVPHVGQDQAFKLLKKCDWVDKTLWVSRQLLGGQAVNGFLRSTATVQRIKKQRARQTQKGKSSTGGDTHESLQLDETNKKRILESSDQEAEELLKKEVMNARTAKKLKSELDIGIEFCSMLHKTIREILKEMDPSLPTIEPLAPENQKLKQGLQKHASDVTNNHSSGSTLQRQNPPGLSSTTLINKLHSDKASGSLVSNADPAGNLSVSVQSQGTSTTASAGEPSGSTLRKNRKKKIPACTEVPINLQEFDSFGKRLCTKKEHMHRLFECIRYRGLRKGDFVAARMDSRQLWILARVLKDYAPSNVPLLDFVRLPESKREQLFKEKVLIKDVEDKAHDLDTSTKVARSLILPLPRSFAEAAEWAQRYKKGSRVYAMYPHTTSLYTATVLDSTTYARDDDDIIVVRFDDDETDSTGSIPACHIPSRFVTQIPRGFPGSQSSTSTPSISSSISGPKKRRGVGSDGANDGHGLSGSIHQLNSDKDLNLDGNFDDLNFDDPLPGLDGFDDLEFDLLGDS